MFWFAIFSRTTLSTVHAVAVDCESNMDGNYDIESVDAGDNADEEDMDEEAAQVLEKLESKSAKKAKQRWSKKDTKEFIIALHSDAKRQLKFFPQQMLPRLRRQPT